jgi:hypothetical protein
LTKNPLNKFHNNKKIPRINKFHIESIKISCRPDALPTSTHKFLQKKKTDVVINYSSHRFKDVAGVFSTSENPHLIYSSGAFLVLEKFTTVEE